MLLAKLCKPNKYSSALGFYSSVNILSMRTKDVRLAG